MTYSIQLHFLYLVSCCSVYSVSHQAEKSIKNTIPGRMKVDSSASEKVGSTVILDVSVMRLNKLNVTWSSSILYYKTCVMLTQCWFNVGQPSDMLVQY